MIEGNFSPRDVGVSEIKHAEKPAKKKRKIHVSILQKVRLKKRDAQPAPVIPPEQKIAFTSARNLHAERGYDAFNFKRIMKKRRRGESMQSTAETIHEHPALSVAEASSLPDSVHANNTSENGNGFKKTHPSLYWLEKSSHAVYDAAKPALAVVGEKSLGFINNIKWGMGWLSRGSIGKKLNSMERDPHAYAAEIEAEIGRSIANVLSAEDPNILIRNKKNVFQGTVTALTLIPAWIPTGLPFPFTIYTGGSAAVTLDNLYNTVQAFRQKRFRKASAYSFMTLGGIATGFFPGAHNLTNTWYTELIQKTYDHTESEGMLKITQSLLREDSSQDRKVLGRQITEKAISDSYDATGVSVTLSEQLQLAKTERQREKDAYIKEIEAIKTEHDKLPGFFRAFAHPTQVFKNAGTWFQLVSRSINVNQQLIDVEHKLRTIPQLEAIAESIKSMQPGDSIPEEAHTSVVS